MAIAHQRNYVQEVLEIFEDYFGADRVDLQTVTSETEEDGIDYYNIIVYFPIVKVTNEYAQSEVIYDLFAKVPVNKNGTLKDTFRLMRSSYTYEQAIVGYTHSHISSCTELGEFGKPCLGTGPIINTINTLEESIQPEDFDNILTFWGLFCREMDEYTQVESLAGGPYIRMENIGAGNSKAVGRYFLTVTTTLEPNSDDIKVIKHILRTGKLRFKFDNGLYNIAMSDTDFAILATQQAYRVSQEMQESVEDFKRNCCEYNFSQGKLFRMGGNSGDRRLRRVGERVFTFKGEDIILKIISTEQESESHTIWILDFSILNRIKAGIIKLINASYGKSNIRKEGVFL